MRQNLFGAVFDGVAGDVDYFIAEGLVALL